MFSTLVSVLVLPVVAEPQVLTFKVGGVDREALVYTGSLTKNAPLVFGFHGHGGGMRQAAKSFNLHNEWPEATVVYMQGLPTKGRTDPKGEKNGWEMRGKNADGGRDVPFFDTLYHYFGKSNKIDLKRVYAMGHSNGGGFTYVLWAVRGDRFAAVAPSAAGGSRVLGVSEPLPAFIIGGRNDTIVSFATIEDSFKRTLELNDAKLKRSMGPMTFYAGKNGKDVVSYFTNGGHNFVKEAVPHMVEFFKSHTR
jgi:polyhydroxybutyrate depolymerase